jgi:rifampicin phosphotransferase
MVYPEPLPPPFIPLQSSHVSLEQVGGKGLNLVKLFRAGFPVPNGFLIPTQCYRDFIVENGLDSYLHEGLARTDLTSPESLQTLSGEIRTQFGQGSIPQGIDSALEIAWRWLGAHPVAVRSSATAEDLPDMSFAGQQDTFLNVIGDDALLKAVIDCWSSLWTARAIGYRARNSIPQDDVALCVIVQNMIPSQASGVLFTANPLTGRRAETVIDATLGLGEALVGGHVEPDHYVVDSLTNRITHKFQGSKSLTITGKPEGGVITQKADQSSKQAIPEEVIHQLADLGERVADLYQFPQDIEWAWISGKDAQAGRLYILQSRPITSLFPLPKDLPPDPLKFMVGLHVVQGVIEPYTPLGQDLIMLVLTGGARLFKLDHTLKSQTAFYIAAERIYINMTAILRTPLGNKFYPQVIKSIDPGVAQAAEELVKDPRFAPKPHRPNLRTLRRVGGFVLPLARQIFRVLRKPEQRKAETLQAFDDIVADTRSRLTSTGDMWKDFAQNLAQLHETKNLFSNFVIPKGVPPIVAGMAPFFGILERFSREVAKTTGDERFITIHLEISRGIPDNVTTDMDLALWQTAKGLHSDPDSASTFDGESAEALASRYLGKTLPPVAQKAVADFMEKYGARGLAEIDVGRKRWQEDPTHIMRVLQSYLAIDDPELAPDVVFKRSAQAAEEAAHLLEDAVRKLPGGRIKARLVRFAVRRYRSVGGLREAPKFFAIRMMGIVRQGLLKSGQEFSEAGLLDQPDDLFFLYIRELDEIALKDEFPSDIRTRIINRRRLRQREMLRKQIPRVLLSDGTAFYEGVSAPEGDSSTLVGDPVSPGVVEGIVRVVFNPHETQLEPGEILVCPGTDPAWTPLFLAAGGLVMEIGGMMTHGSVVAREYGIPAVVGVDRATERLRTGQRVRVNGSKGVIQII